MRTVVFGLLNHWDFWILNTEIDFSVKLFFHKIYRYILYKTTKHMLGARRRSTTCQTWGKY